eukprot:2791381-Rhodomonas_salina.3
MLSCVGCYEMSGTDLACGTMSRRPRAAGTTPKGRILSPISLRACYAMSGTDLLYGTVWLRVCYAMSSTDMAYPATVLCRTTQ